MNRKIKKLYVMLAALLISLCIPFPVFADAGSMDLSQAFFTRLRQSYAYKGKTVLPAFLIAREQIVETDNGDGTATRTIQYIILQKGQDYTASISGNGKIGKATIKAVGKGSYSGTLKTSFVVRPSKTSVKSIRRQKKGLNVNYRKVPGNCSYQVAWHRSGTRRWKRMTRRGDTAVLYDCQPGQRYEVRIRAFKRTASGTYYGKWSETASERA
ncbi:fibronectin type III domain-containing protein [Eubacterium sp. F2]|uniref:fibronectin type III domain-containing protein n=1 Tax=Eubacterium sp. F2 TaxID=3381348 RepID=UPI003908142C